MSSLSNIPNLLLMIRPASFGYNAQTAESNVFQHQSDEPEVTQKARQEFDRMVDQLRAAQVPVIVFDDLKAGLPDSVFSNNWIAHLPDKRLTIFPMYTPNRRAEVRLDIVTQLQQEKICTEVIDLREALDHERFLEGTGSIVFDYRNKMAYACESPRTDVGLFEKYCVQIGYLPVSFLSTDVLDKPIYHTNVVMTMGDRFVLICLDSVSDPIEKKMLEIQMEKSGREIIPLSYQQMNHFAGNCIEVLNERKESLLLMSQTAFDALNDGQKKKLSQYTRLMPFSIPTIETIGGGSVRCMITGLFV